MTTTFRDATLAIVTILDAALAEPVGSRVPNPRPTAFVRVERTGGVRRSMVVDEATVTIEAWAASAEAAQDLAQSARSAVHEAVGAVLAGFGTVYAATELSGPGYSPDPDSGHDRYVFSISVALRGAH